MDHDKRVKTEEAIEILDKVRKICVEFPEVSEQVDSFGHTSFRVKDKPFVMMGEGERVSIAIKTLPETQEFLLQKEGFSKTPYVGQHGWTSFDFTVVPDWDELESLITEGYLRTAPKRLVRFVQS
ncbi:MmcQ/YjbR family DNA-binding protein [Bacillus sp. V59.32b]|uniref:MmcQ/YjbR family DNA-binding protein n=1 Tax=Bacillus sp. V59.32b TaxID=1758642 RepID=UPI000E3D656C|nr:MmcQ/YjbR family DNA-binding protein [Bacillus sp. V59.32b]RFU60138.1 MmcQ/YjbR family DNA-binding protein [Bacillus sp. V59.32b]